MDQGSGDPQAVDTSVDQSHSKVFQVYTVKRSRPESQDQSGREGGPLQGLRCSGIEELNKHVKTCLRTSLMEFIFHQTTMIELNDAVERFEIAWAIVGRKGFRVEEMLYNPIERIS